MRYQRQRQRRRARGVSRPLDRPLPSSCRNAPPARAPVRRVVTTGSPAPIQLSQRAASAGARTAWCDR